MSAPLWAVSADAETISDVDRMAREYIGSRIAGGRLYEQLAVQRRWQSG